MALWTDCGPVCVMLVVPGYYGIHCIGGAMIPGCDQANTGSGAMWVRVRMELEPVRY